MVSMAVCRGDAIRPPSLRRSTTPLPAKSAGALLPHAAMARDEVGAIKCLHLRNSAGRSMGARGVQLHLRASPNEEAGDAEVRRTFVPAQAFTRKFDRRTVH